MNSELHNQTTLIAHDGMHEEASLLQQFLSYGLDCGKDKSEASRRLFQTITGTQKPEVHPLALFQRPWRTRLISALTSGVPPALKLRRPEVHGWRTHSLQRSGSSIWNDIGLHKCHCLGGLMKSNACAAFTSWGQFLHRDGGAASVSLYTVSYRNEMYRRIFRCLGVKVGA